MNTNRCYTIAPRRRSALSLLELLAVLAILGALVLLIIPRVGTGAHNAKAASCQVNQANIDLQCMMWRRNHGSWPSEDLSDIGRDTRYFPDGLPKCPLDDAYRIDPKTGRSFTHKH